MHPTTTVPRSYAIPSLEVYEKEFLRKFRREMTAEEKRFYRIACEALKGVPDTEEPDGEPEAKAS